MRHFKLVNSTGEVLDITTKEILFHEIGGLGFEEENDFRMIGDIWWLNHTNYNQATVSGKMIFTEIGELDPYAKFMAFAQFVSKPPLTLMYNPYGEVYESTCYYRTVRVSRLDKSEKNEYGVIDSDIDFVCYTPWYKISEAEYDVDASQDDGSAWIWGDGTNENPPLIFEPSDSQTVRRIAKFRWEARKYLSIKCNSVGKNPVKLTIYGPMTNPVWTQMLVDQDGHSTIVATGGFSTPVTLLAGERLVIDSTNGAYSITKYNLNGTVSDMYQHRDFSKVCFLTLKEGDNTILVSGNGDVLADRVKVEGHIYYATV